ncbi:MAG TPA: histidine phosphatase family protein [Methylophilaceae bacterium]|nr:histidine phosphatase family protein [Methylophilaceae bacterium]
MELILWRHAEAEDSLPDRDRVLTPHGLEQAEKMAVWLKPRLTADTRILVSPAKRTQQTAAALGLDFSTLEALAPGASASELLQAAGWPDAAGMTLVIGHQPTLGMAAAYAMTGHNNYWNVRKAAVWWISSRRRDGEQQLMVRTVMSPEQL